MRNTRRGYSLIEVLIAFAIMTVVLAALLPGQTRLLSRTGAEEQRLLALDWATSEIEALGLTSPIVSGRRTVTWNDWTMSLTITPEPAVTGVFTVNAEVTVGSDTRLAEITMLRGAP